ncbi:REP-associated tyrosine transposase [Desulfoluna spongiiphila]|uniref:REP-associated tyrosine transposase n=1 Tax=Desulfoluna spongiiphila TaxID=419481 RepID=UPI0012520030|nr:transposase [Desulfoluna spongiiphila]VVS94227.1 trp repressor/replication initiator [Desulfoluna spongiiphila]
MARPLRITFPGAFYHVTSRGNERKTIYKSKRDREKFLEYLGEAHERYGAIIHAYCLMSNHYHILIETPDANLPQIMKHLNGSYTTYFNVKRKRYGHLFQGRYKAILVFKDDYAMELARYIHLNPVRAAMVEDPEDFPWSSHRVYIGKEKAPEWLETSFVLGCFSERLRSAQQAFAAFVSDKKRIHAPSPLEKVSAATILGPESFVEGISKKYLEGRRSDPELPALKALQSRPSLDLISQVVHEVVNDPNLARKLEIYLMKKYSGAPLKAIGRHFGLGTSGVSKVCQRFEMELQNDRKLNKVLMEARGLIP